MTGDTRESMKPLAVVGESREVWRITADRRVIVSGDIYDAAREFWDVVRQMAPEGFTVECGRDRA